MTSSTDPVVCSLTSSQADHRLAEWADLRNVAASVEALDHGVRFCIPAKFADDAADLAALESECCTFLATEIAPCGELIEMTVTSDSPDGVAVVHLLAGLEPT